jgi:hypothetical protein
MVDASGRIAHEAKAASETGVVIAWSGRLEVLMTRIGLNAVPLSHGFSSPRRTFDGRQERRRDTRRAELLDSSSRQTTR